jgi:hypothetical protein
MKINRLTQGFLLAGMMSVTTAFSPVELTAQADPVGVYEALPGYPRPVNIRLNEIPGQAYRHFQKNFSRVEAVSWSRENRGFQVRFQRDGLPSQAHYDLHGNFRYAVRYFEAGQFDAQIMDRIKRAFPGYQPDIISEIDNDTRLVYLVTLKNDFSMKSIMVRDGDIQVIDDLSYASR